MLFFPKYIKVEAFPQDCIDYLIDWFQGNRRGTILNVAEALLVLSIWAADNFIPEDGPLPPVPDDGIITFGAFAGNATITVTEEQAMSIAELESSVGLDVSMPLFAGTGSVIALWALKIVIKKALEHLDIEDETIRAILEAILKFIGA